VLLGFAGSRRLTPAGSDSEALDVAIQDHLTKRLKELRDELGLRPTHFFCGLSSLAVGADTLFTRACQNQDIPQRIVLPQPRNDFLNARSASGTADFSDAERTRALALFDSPHIIHEQVVSHAGKRESRFEDVNLAIARGSDVVVCLCRADADAKPGGTQHLLHLARKRGLPTLEIRVGLNTDGQAEFTETWYNGVLRNGRLHYPGATDTGEPTPYQPPQLPEEIKDVPAAWPEPDRKLPTAEQYCGALKTPASVAARRQQLLFRYSAVVIILTHLAATILATTVLVTHAAHGPAEAHSGDALAAWLLGAELVLLAVGLAVHLYLHHSHAAKVWAFNRLVAEITRSITAIGSLHLHLEHLYWLPLPARLRPLWRTLDILYLRSTRPHRLGDWKPLRDRYVHERLDKANGQIDFYRDKQRQAAWHLWIGGTVIFLVCTMGAIAATLAKLGLVLDESASGDSGWLPGVLGFCAIVLPVAAIGALSYTAAMDCPARAHTYEEALRFLEEQRELLRQAESFREFAALLLETESWLIGETTSWYYRRSFTSVA
jgi:hypothetical protein